MSSTTTYNNFKSYLKNTKDVKLSSTDSRLVYAKWNQLVVIATADRQFVNFDELCKSFKIRKIKTGNSSHTSCFKTHFIKHGFYENHSDLFKEINGQHYIHISLVQTACHGIMNGVADEWFFGFPINLEGCGKGWIYLIYIPGLDVFKFGKADVPEVRFTNYISELNKHGKNVSEKGVMILLVLKVRNMSFSEEVIGVAFDEAKFELRDKSNEYYHVPFLKGESESDRAERVKNAVEDAILDEKMNLDWYWGNGNCKEYVFNENIKLPKK